MRTSSSFISLRRLFSFSNAFIRFLSCWFSSAIFRDSSGLRSPQPISRLPFFAFLIQPYSVFTGIWSSFAAFAAPVFWQALLPALCTLFHIVYFLTFLFLHFFFSYFIPLRLECQVLLYYITGWFSKTPVSSRRRCAQHMAWLAPVALKYDAQKSCTTIPQ